MSAFGGVFRRDLALALRRRQDLVNTLAFFAMVTLLFPLGVGADAGLLQAVAPGVLWAAALLAATLSLGRLFEADHADGTLEQMALSVESLPLLVLAKVAAHWLATGAALTLLAPLLALQFGMAADRIAVLCAALLLGTPVLSLLGAVAAALTLGVRAAGTLAALLVLPLFVPVLVFGAGATAAAGEGPGAQAHLLVLGALLLASLALAPWAAAGALRIALE